MSYDKKTNRYIGYIYQIKNKLNGNIYVGQTSRTIDIRWKQHVNATKWHIRSTYIDKDIAKFGEENFDIDWLAIVDAETNNSLHEILNELEREYIVRNNCLYKNNKHGYNITPGGDPQVAHKKPVDVYNIHGELIHQFSSRKETSEKLGICEVSIIHCCQGKISNVDCKYVFRNVGEPFDKYDVTNHYRYKNIYQFDLDGNLIALYHSKTEIPYDYNSNINVVIDKPTLTMGGYWWSSTNNFLYIGPSNKKSVDVYNKNKEFICTYESIAECSRQINVSITSVQDCCSGRSVTCNGNYYIRFHNEPLNKYNTKPIKKHTKCKIGQFTLDDNLINIFNTMTEAANFLNKKSASKISLCCNNRSKQAYGYKWKFIEKDL